MSTKGFKWFKIAKMSMIIYRMSPKKGGLANVTDLAFLLISGRSFRMSATLVGGGVNKILTFCFFFSVKGLKNEFFQ